MLVKCTCRFEFPCANDCVVMKPECVGTTEKRHLNRNCQSVFAARTTVRMLQRVGHQERCAKIPVARGCSQL